MSWDPMADGSGRGARRDRQRHRQGAEDPQALVPYRPRPAFEPYHARAQRWAIMVCHRRAGKTVATINDLILRIGHCKRKNPRGAYIAPLHKQAKDAAWDYLKDYGLTIPGAEARESELSLELPNGGQSPALRRRQSRCAARHLSRRGGAG